MDILDVPFHKLLYIKEYPGDEYIMRPAKTEIKYHRPANGRLFNEDCRKVLTAVFDWFLTKQ